LIAKPGTPIYSVASNGIVIQGPKFFYHGTYSLVIKYPTFVVRYGEIKQEVPPEIYEGATVEEGQLIAHVGKMHNSSMLHFEMYDGSETGPLTVKGNPPYQRRKDLIDPTPYLDTWKLMTQFSNFIDSILDF
jgi:murein DD-endopeptidase MepM/ murein hydrolase activator NlpD